LMWVESIVCNISVVFLGHSVETTYFTDSINYASTYTRGYNVSSN